TRSRADLDIGEGLTFPFSSVSSSLHRSILDTAFSNNCKTPADTAFGRNIRWTVAWARFVARSWLSCCFCCLSENSCKAKDSLMLNCRVIVCSSGKVPYRIQHGLNTYL